MSVVKRSVSFDFVCSAGKAGVGSGGEVGGRRVAGDQTGEAGFSLGGCFGWFGPARNLGLVWFGLVWCSLGRFWLVDAVGERGRYL